MEHGATGNNGVLEREVRERVGLCQDLATIPGHHGGGLVPWDMEVCCGLGWGSAASPHRMVLNLCTLHWEASGRQQQGSELCIVYIYRLGMLAYACKPMSDQQRRGTGSLLYIMEHLIHPMSQIRWCWRASKQCNICNADLLRNTSSCKTEDQAAVLSLCIG